MIVRITDDNGVKMESQALKFASLAWGQVTPAAKLGTAGMPLRGFGRAFPVDHIDENKTNNNVSNGNDYDKSRTRCKNETGRPNTIAKQAMSKSAPCTMTVFDLEGKPLLDSEGKPIVENYPIAKKLWTITSLHHTRLQILLNAKIYLPEIAWSRSNTKVRTAWRNSPGTTCPILKVKFGNPSRKADHKTMEQHV